MANILTDKKYLDATGVKVLVSAIEKLKSNADASDATLNSRLDDLIAKLGLQKDENGDWMVELIDGSVLAEIFETLADIREDLGDYPEDYEYEDVFTALVDIKDILTKYMLDADGRIDLNTQNIKDLRGDLGVNDQPETDAFARIQSLEADMATSAQDSFTKVAAAYDPATHKIHVHFGSKEVDVVGDICDDEHCTGKGHFTINTDDFVKNGMIQEVNMVTLPADADKAWYDAHPFAPGDNDSKGKKFIVIKFNTQSEANPNPGDHSENDGFTEVWLAVDGLFNDYDFSAASEDEDYLKVSVSETNSTTGDKVNQVDYTVGLGDKAKENFDLIEGKVATVVDEVHKAPAEDGSDSVLLGKLEKLREHIYGIREVSVAVDELDKAVAANRNLGADIKSKLEALRGEFDAYVTANNARVTELEETVNSNYTDVVETFKKMDSDAEAMKADLKIVLDHILEGTPLPEKPNMFID